MFAIVYYWTPPHFWALALLKQGEYGRAAVPMLPNVVGEAETRKQVLLYTVILTAISLMPVVFGLGEIYFASAVVLSGIFLALVGALVLPAQQAAGAGDLLLLALVPGPDLRRDGYRPGGSRLARSLCLLGRVPVRVSFTFGFI